jgi:hypothetical protein
MHGLTYGTAVYFDCEQVTDWILYHSLDVHEFGAASTDREGPAADTYASATQALNIHQAATGCQNNEARNREDQLRAVQTGILETKAPPNMRWDKMIQAEFRRNGETEVWPTYTLSTLAVPRTHILGSLMCLSAARLQAAGDHLLTCSPTQST